MTRSNDTRGSDHLLVLLLFVALTTAMFVRTWLQPTTTWVGWPGDPAQHMWFLRWLPYALGQGENPLFTTHINHPDGVNLMWNTAMPLPALVLTPVTVLLGPFVSYNLFVTAGIAVSGWCMYLLARRYVRSTGPALAAGLLYAFSPYVMSQALGGHSNLVQVYVPPLLFLTLDEVFVRQRRSPYVLGAALGAMGSVQFLITEEVLASEALVAATALVTLMVSRRAEVRPRAPYAVRALATGVAVMFLVIWVPFVFQFLGPQRVEGGTAQARGIFSSDLVSFVVPSELQALSPGWAEDMADRYTDACCRGEWGSYLGFPLIALTVWIVVRYRQRLLVRLLAVLAAVFAVLSMGPRLHVAGNVTDVPLPFWVVEELPLLQNMLPRRLMLYVFLAVALLVALYIDDRWPRVRDRRERLRVAAILAVALAPLVPAFPFPSTEGRVPSFFTSDAVRRLERGSVVVVYPFSRSPATAEPLLWQARSDMWFRMPEGYILGPDSSGRYAQLPEPNALFRAMERIERAEPLARITAAHRRGVLEDMADAEVSAVVVGRSPTRHIASRFFTELLGRRPVRVGGVDLWEDVDPAALLGR